MNVFVSATGRRIEPFNDPASEALIQNRPLGEWQREAFRDAGLTVIDTLRPPCLVVPDTIFCTGGALRAFLDGAAGRDAVLVVARSVFGRNTSKVQPTVEEVEAGWRYSDIRFVSGQEAAPVDVMVDPAEEVHELPSPPFFREPEPIQFSLPRDPVMTLHHWVHILWANQLVGGVELRRTPKWRLVLTGLWAVLRARSFNKWRVLSKLNRIGRGCDIHPTAVVEGSTLGDGVTVGAFARVLFSTIGEGASLMPGTQVEFSVLGPKSTVSEKCTVRFSVLYPGAVMSQYLMQQCVLGDRAVTTGGAFSMDLNFDQDIRVTLDGRLFSTGQKFLGSAFGHRCRVGTGFWLASGRSVPNDYFLIRDPDRVLSKLPPDLPIDQPLIVDGRTLRPSLPSSTEG